jgi:crotonobetainyl-CoA:carnitine CoA-transferase CaiB-like acyl-CoA transferase
LGGAESDGDAHSLSHARSDDRAVRRAAPTLGQDNQHVLESILGYDETRITELVASRALG